MRIKKIITVLGLAGLLALAGCSKESAEAAPESLPYYDECTHEEGAVLSNMNNNLFYRNELVYGETIQGADPAVIQITDEEDPDYGKFVLTITSGSYSFSGYISDDLVNWEPIGLIMKADDSGDTDKSKVLYYNTWAPEMVWDEEDGKYYLFFSATPCNKTEVTGYGNDSGATSSVFNREYTCLPYVAVSDSFRGPFELIDHNDTYRYADGTPMQRNGEEVPKADAPAVTAHAEITDNAMGYSYFLKYSVFDPYLIWEAICNSDDPYVREIADYEPTKILRSIDFHPFVAENGEKYLYFVCNKDGAYSENNSTYVMGIRMESWTEPDYSTLSRLSRYGYYEVDDMDDGTIERPAYENTDAHINEGPWMTEHNGKYYLTLSVNGYGTTFYKVVQAISDSPLGPFRKLTENEGGVLLGADSIDDVSGPGHHALVEVGDEMYIVYHKHNDPLVGGNERHIATNQVKWTSITDKDGQELDVMYANGPTTGAIQPLPEFASGYDNIASRAEVEASNLYGDSKASFLNDGLVPVFTGLNVGYTGNYVRSAEFSGETEISLTFEDYETIRAIMIYNSEWIENAFYEIEEIAFDTRDGEKVICHLAFDWEANSNAGFSMSPAGAAIAEFDETEAREIRIKVKPATSEELPMHDSMQEAQLAIGEIVVLGKE